MRRKSLVMLSLAIGACAAFADPAVELAACINRGAEQLRNSQLDSLRVECPVRGNRTVTAALFPDQAFASSTDSQKVSSLRALGLPADAIFYSGPDSPSVGGLVSLGPVYVYDGSFRDNRKYRTTTSLASDIRVARPMAATGNKFTIDLERTDRGSVEIVRLQPLPAAVVETTE